MSGMRWGRLQWDVNCHLRRGAWYRVMEEASLQATVDVNRQPLTVPRYLLQVASTPPSRWTVVPKPQNAVGPPADWGTRYAVCPSCRTRAPLPKRARRMHCEHCQGVFEVAWDEAYLADS